MKPITILIVFFATLAALWLPTGSRPEVTVNTVEAAADKAVTEPKVEKKEEKPVKAPEKPPEPVSGVDNTIEQNIALGKYLASERGWTGSQWNCLKELWTKESHWDHYAQNPYSTAYGIAQFLDSTWSLTGYAKSSNPKTQILAGLKYIEIDGDFSTPCGALAFHRANNWY